MQCSKETIRLASAMARKAGVKKAGTSDQMALARAIAAHYGQELPVRHAQVKAYLEGFVENAPEGPELAAPQKNIKGWAKLRYEALVKHGGKCQCCGRTPAHGAVLNVDHVKPVSRYPELSTDIDNLQVLCELCNAGKGAWDETDWR